MNGRMCECLVFVAARLSCLSCKLSTRNQQPARSIGNTTAVGGKQRCATSSGSGRCSWFLDLPPLNPTPRAHIQPPAQGLATTTAARHVVASASSRSHRDRRLFCIGQANLQPHVLSVDLHVIIHSLSSLGRGQWPRAAPARARPAAEAPAAGCWLRLVPRFAMLVLELLLLHAAPRSLAAFDKQLAIACHPTRHPERERVA